MSVEAPSAVVRHDDGGGYVKICYKCKGSGGGIPLCKVCGGSGYPLWSREHLDYMLSRPKGDEQK